MGTDGAHHDTDEAGYHDANRVCGALGYDPPTAAVQSPIRSNTCASCAAHACKALLLLSKDNNEEDDHGGDDGDDENKTRTKKKKEEDEGSGVHYAAKFSRDSARTRQCGSS
jgi:hypothetical protein